MDSDEEDSVVGDDGSVSGFSHTPPSAKKQKKAPVKKTGGKPLAPIENESFMQVDGPSENKPKTKKTATETYQKLTQLEHIIKRPDTYIGSVERNEQQMWVFNKETSQMEKRNVSFVPGLYKIFDEILVNAADNKQRDPEMSHLKVKVDRQTGEISIENNGKGIAVEVHGVRCSSLPCFPRITANSTLERRNLHPRNVVRSPAHRLQLR
jgi:DNA topoisomerase II